ncbi:Kinetochore-associated protein NSL1 [Nakaseomyces bracarensis]|uniref:Kinetochore-associated protein NSL1 n=1 Tax=Nakaseomyces bracarensis TaxID=273131 RepID=A0ABR4NRJ1_9SACH
MNHGSGRVRLTVGQLRSIYGQLHGLLEDRMAQMLGGHGRSHSRSRNHRATQGSVGLQSALEEEEEGEDKVRREVQLRLQEYLLRVMDMASDSIEVVDAEEGKSVRELIMESREKFLEPFDIDLNERVREQYHHWEDANVKISQLRRRGPEAVRSLYAAEQETYLAEVDKRIEQLEIAKLEEEEEEEDEKGITVEQQQVFLDALKSLMSTQSRIPEIRSDLDTTTNMVSYLDNA